MEERAGCGIGAGVLFLVMALFGAGYLFAADNLAASRAAEAAKAAEAVRVANEARLDAEAARAAAEARMSAAETALARLELENAALAEQVRLANEQGGELARLREQLTEAANELEREKALRIIAEQRAGVTDNVIPPSGDPDKIMPINEMLLWGLGIGVSGLVIVLITRAVRPSQSEQKWIRADDDCVMVKMSRAEARAYARRRGRG
jgi:hypothetical protein